LSTSVPNASTRLTLGGVISGSGGLLKAGPGILRLSGVSANSYTGLTTVSAGTLELNKSTTPAVPGDLTINSGGTARHFANDQIANTSTVTVNAGGAFNLNNFFDEIGPLKVLGGNVTTGSPRLIAGPVTMTGGNIDATDSQLLLKGDVTINAASSPATIRGVVNLFGV